MQTKSKIMNSCLNTKLLNAIIEEMIIGRER